MPRHRSEDLSDLQASSLLGVPTELLAVLRKSARGGPRWFMAAGSPAYHEAALMTWRAGLEKQAAAEVRRALMATCEFTQIEWKYMWPGETGFPRHPRFNVPGRAGDSGRRAPEAAIFAAVRDWFERELQADEPDGELIRAALCKLGCDRIRARYGKKQLPAWREVWLKATQGVWEKRVVAKLHARGPNPVRFSHTSQTKPPRHK